MAIELTLASDEQKRRIRNSLKAVGVSGNNFFVVNGDMLATGLVTITGGPGQDTGLTLPNGQINIGYSAPLYGNSNDGGTIYFNSIAPDQGELVIQTRDNGNEPIVFRQTDPVNSYEPLVIGSNKNVGINVPLGVRSFDNTLSVYGNISASGSLFVQSVVQSSQSPLTIDVDTSSPALRVVQRGTGFCFQVLDEPSDTSIFVINQFGNVGIGTAAPNEKLAVIGNTVVVGNTTVAGNISASGTIFANNIQGGTTFTNAVTSPTTVIGGVSGIRDVRVMTQVAYNLLSSRDPSTLYIIV